MNTSQKAFTYIDNFARDIRDILEQRFFIDCGKYTEKERTKGVLERVVLESIMCMFHLEHWKKQTKQMNTYLNEHASKGEFERFRDNLCRLEGIITEDISALFTSKDSFIWFTLFHRFSDLGMEDERFAEFLRSFQRGLKNKAVNGEVFASVDKNKGTKDRAVIMDKLYILETLMNAYLNIGEENRKNTDKLAFVKENVNRSAMQEDIEQYEEVLDALTLNVDNTSRLLDQGNRMSLVGLVAYSFANDIDLDEWIVDFFQRNHTYIRNQKENYIYMKNDLMKWRKMVRLVRI